MCIMNEVGSMDYTRIEKRARTCRHLSKGAIYTFLAIWALIGSLIMVPVSYAETLIAKVMKQTPKEYIGNLLTPGLAMIYAVGFCALHIFGFGGFQFSGIDSVVL